MRPVSTALLAAALAAAGSGNAAAPAVTAVPDAAATAVTAAPAAASPFAPTFEVRRGESLTQVLSRWTADRADLEVVWKSDYDYQLEANAQFKGDLMSALAELSRFVALKNPTFQVRLHANGVILVTDSRK